jgi:hypothetical protein
MISSLSVGRAGSADWANAGAGGLASVGVNKRSGSSQMNAPIARTTPRARPERVSAEVDDGCSLVELCTRRSFKVKGWETDAGSGMPGFAIMGTPLMTGVALAYPHLTYCPNKIAKNGRVLPDDDAFTIAQGIASVGAVVHISIDGAIRASDGFPRPLPRTRNPWINPREIADSRVAA